MTTEPSGAALRSPVQDFAEIGRSKMPKADTNIPQPTAISNSRNASIVVLLAPQRFCPGLTGSVCRAKNKRNTCPKISLRPATPPPEKRSSRHHCHECDRHLHNSSLRR